MTARGEIAPGDWAHLERDLMARGVIDYGTCFPGGRRPSTVSGAVRVYSWVYRWFVGRAVFGILREILREKDLASAGWWMDSFTWSERKSWTPDRVAFAIRTIREFLGYEASP